MSAGIAVKRLGVVLLVIAASCILMNCSESRGGPGETLTSLREMWQAGRYSDAGDLMTAT